jgi:cell wall-associated NlpC family hydrolase
MAAAAGAVLVLILPVVLISAVLGGSPALQAAACQAGQAPTPLARQAIPPDYLAWYLQAGQAYSVPWAVLAGIGTIESDNGQSHAPGVHSGHNYAGAEGPMQFLPATFAMYAAGPDLPRTPYDPADAIPTAANMLRHDGAATGTLTALKNAIFAYNHATWYVNEVLAWAARYATGTSHITTTVSAQCQVLALGLLPGGTRGKILSFAFRQLGKPYQWGATGPGSYDCSGLTMMAYRAAGITIPRTSQQQWAYGPRIPLAQVRPGDLVFFAGADGTRTAPGHVGIVIAVGTMIDAPFTGAFVRIDHFSESTVSGYTAPVTYR